MKIQKRPARSNRTRYKIPDEIPSQLAEAGRYYLTQCGLSVFPVDQHKEPNTGRRRNQWKQWQSERPTVKELLDAIDHPRTAGIAAVCGQVSGGLACRDFDTKDSFARWRAAHSDLAAILPIAESYKGFNVWFRCPLPVRTIKYDDGELRGERSYTLLPPSWVFAKDYSRPHRRRWLTLMTPEIPIVADLVAAGLARAPRDVMGGVTYEAECNRFVSPESLGIPPASVAEAIARTLPRRPGERHRRLFDFARALKGLEPDATPATLRMYLLDWHRQALPFIRTKSFSTSLEEFVVAWHNAKTSLVSMKTVMAQAREMRVPLEVAAYPPKQQFLVKVCAALQQQWGDQPFFLGVSQVQEILASEGQKVCRMTAWRKLQVLMFDRVIEQVQVGTYSEAPQQRRATRWRYLLPIRPPSARSG